MVSLIFKINIFAQNQGVGGIEGVVMYTEWLLEECSVDYIERKALEEIIKYRPDWIGTEKAVPFGAINKDWVTFKSQILPGDKIHFFRSDSTSWSSLAGREGYSLVRDGQIITNICTRLS